MALALVSPAAPGAVATPFAVALALALAPPPAPAPLPERFASGALRRASRTIAKPIATRTRAAARKISACCRPVRPSSSRLLSIGGGGGGGSVSGVGTLGPPSWACARPAGARLSTRTARMRTRRGIVRRGYAETVAARVPTYTLRHGKAAAGQDRAEE